MKKFLKIVMIFAISILLFVLPSFAGERLFITTDNTVIDLSDTERYPDGIEQIIVKANNVKITGNGTVISPTYPEDYKEEDKETYGNRENYAAILVKGGSLTIESGKFISNTGCKICNHAALYVKGNSTVTVNGGIFEGKGKDIAVRVCGEEGKATLEINKGTFTSQYLAGVADCGGVLNIKGGTWSSEGYYNGQSDVLNIWTMATENPGKISVTGGTFVNFNPSIVFTEGSYASGKPKSITNAIVDGYEYNSTTGEVVCAHTDVNHNLQKDPTYLANGTVEHWLCNTCSTIFLDEAKTVKGTEADLVLPKLVQVSSSGNAKLETEAVDSAISDSDILSSSTITIPLSALGENVSSATLPLESLKDVANTDKELAIVTTEAKTTIDAKALDSIIEQAGNATDVKVEVTKIPGMNLNEKQKESLKDKTVSVVFSAKVLAGNNTISDFGGGKVRIEIPYMPVENEKMEDFVVVYIADNGDITEIPTKYLDEKLVVELEHFSEYAVVKKVDLKAGENQKGDSSNSSSTSAPAEPAKDVTPKTGILDMSLIIVSVIGIVALAGVVVIKKYNK